MKLLQIMGLAFLLSVWIATNIGAAIEPISVTFSGETSAHQWSLQELDAGLPTDWSSYNYLVLEMRTSSPQRFSLWLYTADGRRRIMLQPYGQNVWLRASIPLQYFKGRESGHDLASANNRRTDALWMSVWGPFGSLDRIQSLGVTMKYPIEQPTLEIRALSLAREDPGSDFLEGKPVLDEFGQWAHVDWPRKIKSAEQLERELAAEAETFTQGSPFAACEYGGYRDKQRVENTGFFRVQKIDGIWWLVDPHGHLFLSTGANCIRGRDRRNTDVDTNLIERRMTAWGLNTVGNWSSFRESEDGRHKVYVATFRSPRTDPLYLGMPDVYSDTFAHELDQAAQRQCTPIKDDPWLLGYFIGNEPPWPDRESELVDMFLNGEDTATKTKLQAYLAEGDSPQRREQFIHAMFERYLDMINATIKKYDANHLNLGIRFGGHPPEAVCRMAKKFDVCSINVYEYEPTQQVQRAFELTGRPVMIGEFHFGVPANGLGAGLVQAMNQQERAAGYRYYVEQAMALPCFLGAHWFQWQDQPVLGRFDGENYNIGLVDVTNRAYPEMVEALKATHKVLFDVHTGRVPPFSHRPLASEAGTPASPWGD